MLKNQVIVITGASSGIGAETARLLSEQGAKVILAARSLDKLEAVGRTLKGPYEIIELDVGSDASVGHAFEQIWASNPRIDCLLNNAGYGRFERFVDTTVSEFEDMMNVNYLGIVRCTRAVLPRMLEQGGGQIVNVASMAGKLATAKSTAYSATKHAVLGFTNALRQEVRGTGIVISAVNPGPIDTPFFTLADPGGDYVKNVGWMMMKPQRVSKAIVKVIERRKAEVDLPWIAGFGTRLYQLVPRLADKLTYKFINKK
ncbi:oxidoreductase [Paenibacillus sp. CAA11]|uniref:SDR family NAD(P)-dependent oxidoreductase n=1 Tax=Paenibacillus sp. CAA11 TaxID=1532905 RepID=UPI000D39C2AC|nr:SDR family oxidoreductase [Paenibacillus sp. CAA11]AWB45840.1 oxidoreductase [Paenibacillus sp. CAA11]